MLVTVTKPLEEAVNTVPGLDHLSSITSRGTAEIDLFFTLERGHVPDAGTGECGPGAGPAHAAANAKLTANRLTFAAFPIMGYSLTSDKIPQTALWEMANYTTQTAAEPRRRAFRRWWCRAGRCRNFRCSPTPPSWSQTGVTIPNILDAISRSNMIDSPGLIETNHQLVLTLMSGQARTPADIGNIVVKTTPAGAPVHIGDVGHGARFGDARLHRRDGQSESRPCCSISSASRTATR